MGPRLCWVSLLDLPVWLFLYKKSWDRLFFFFPPLSLSLFSCLVIGFYRTLYLLGFVAFFFVIKVTRSWKENENE